MSIRSLIIGILAALFVAGAGYLNDSVLRLTPLVGNHLPIFVFGALAVFAMAINPLLYLIGKGVRLRPGELAVIVALMLVACSIPGSGLMRTFPHTLVMPAQMARTNPGWEKNEVLSFVPGKMLAGGGHYDPEVQEGFMSGTLKTATPPLTKPSTVPWHKWRTPLTTWLPIILLTAVCVISMSLVVHRQWVSRERLRYPIADFASSLMAQEPDRGAGTIFRNRLFWAGLITVLLIRTVNGLHAWYPSMLSIPLTLDLSQISQKWPDLARAPKAYLLYSPVIFPAVVGFAFFLASDVSLSLGLSQVLFVPIFSALALAGIDTSTEYFTGGGLSDQLFGSFLGMALLLLYTGRRHYVHVLKQAFTFRQEEGVEGYAAWAFRFGLLAAVALVLILWLSLGLDLIFSVLLVLLVLMMFLVMARINAETGLFFCQPTWQPIGVLIGIFGFVALGPKALIIAGLVCAVLTIDPRESLMPFVVNGLKMCDRSGVKPSRVGIPIVAVFVLGLAVAILVVLGSAYARGTAGDGWALNSVPKFAPDTTSRAIDQLSQDKLLRESMELESAERVTHAVPSKKFLVWAAIGLGLVLVVSFLRLRFTWWPIHPVMFLVWGTYPIGWFSHSFLLGWLIKAVVTKLGGGQKYRELQPLMVGVIAGDLLGGLIFMGAGAAYYALYQQVPPTEYNIFPG